MLAFTFFVALVTGLIFGLGPALRASRVDPNSALKEGGRGSVGTSAFGLGHGQLRKILITAEVALSLVLLIGAGLLIRSYARISNANPGFNPHNVLSLRVSLPGFRYKTPEMVSSVLPAARRARARASRSGVRRQQLSIAVELRRAGVGTDRHRGLRSESGRQRSHHRQQRVHQLRLSPRDGRAAPQGPLLHRAGQQAIARSRHRRRQARRALLAKRGSARQAAYVRDRTGTWRTVVGVVADAKEYEVDAEPPITAYFPVEQYNIAGRFVVVRTRANSDAANLTNAVAQEIRRLDPELPAYDVATMEHRLHDSLARRRLSMFLLGTFAAFALVLAAIGIYGVIAYWVDQRTREIGIRMALGADRRRILSLIAREFLVMIGVGLAIGLGGAFALTRVMSGLLFGVSATDVTTFGLIPVVLAVIAVAATYLPARRAMRVEPIVAVRAE